MTPNVIDPAVDFDFESAARQFEANLPLEHYMESIPHRMQRCITINSFDYLKIRRTDIQLFGDLLIQAFRPDGSLVQVVPDEMIVVSESPVASISSYNIPLEAVGPFMVLEYISPSNAEKDLDKNFVKYEKDLKVPYYFLFNPDERMLWLYRLDDDEYVPVERNSRGRLAIPELDLEVAVHEGWARFWYKNELLPITAETVAKLDELIAERDAANRKAEEFERQAIETRKSLEAVQKRLAELESELARNKKA